MGSVYAMGMLEGMVMMVLLPPAPGAPAAAAAPARADCLGDSMACRACTVVGRIWPWGLGFGKPCVTGRCCPGAVSARMPYGCCSIGCGLECPLLPFPSA